MYVVDSHIVDPYTDDEFQDMYYGTISYNEKGNSHAQKIEVRDISRDDLKDLLKVIADALNNSKQKVSPKTTTDAYDHAMDII